MLYSMDVVLSVCIIANNACIINLLTGKSYELAEVKWFAVAAINVNTYSSCNERKRVKAIKCFGEIIKFDRLI